MDFKELLNQAKKHRFWILVGVAAVLPLIAYFTASGSLKAATETKAKQIETVDKDVKQYNQPGVVNQQYAPVVDEKTKEVEKDVNASWRVLYDRQSHILAWPTPDLETKFGAWGRKWPENVAPNAVQDAIQEYKAAYLPYVDKVYQIFKPFNTEDGTGIVAAPTKENLLVPAEFTESEIPDMSAIWAAQERLWLQRALLEVVAEVNKDATDWSSAPIKQINYLEVGTVMAQDQVSIAKNELLVPPPELKQGGAAANVEKKDTSSSSMDDAYAAMMSPGSASGTAPTEVLSIKTDSEKYRIYPIYMSVLVEQEHIQDFLVALRNSPMAVQIKEVEINRPAERVQKPAKGVELAISAGGGTLSGYGSSGDDMKNYGPQKSNAANSPYAKSQMALMKMYSSAGASGGALGGAATERQGVDLRSKKKKEKKKREFAKVEVFDPYYNIVEVGVYGQARFYSPPPAAEAGASSEAEAFPAPAAPAPSAEAAEPKAEATEEKPEVKAAPSPEPPKAQPAEPKAKPEEPKKGEGTKAESPASKAKDKPAEPKGEPKKATSPATKT